MIDRIKRIKGIAIILVFVLGVALGRFSLNDSNNSTQERIKQETISNEKTITVDNEQIDLIDKEAESKEDMVWVSETGKCYHKINNCGNMNPYNARKVSKKEAENIGLKKCSKCW